MADVQAALMLLGTVPEVDAERLGIYGTSYGGATVVWTGAVDSRVKCVVSVVGIGDGARWMRGVRRPDEFHDLLQRAAQDRKQRALDGKSEFVKREEILLPEGVGDIKPLLGKGPAFPQRGRGTAIAPILPDWPGTGQTEAPA